MRQLSKSLLFLLSSGAAAAATTAITGSTIDTLGFEDVTIKVGLGAITATGVVTAKAQGGAAADGSDKADIAFASTAAPDTASNQFLLIEIHRPKQRYITPIVNRTVANSVITGIEVILSNPGKAPVTQTAVANVVSLNSPNLA